MKTLFRLINTKLSLRLSFSITLFLVLIFVVSLGILFVFSRKMVHDEAIERTQLELQNMVQRVNGLMNEVEVATETAEWCLDDEQLQPDSLLYNAKRIVAMNSNFDGCSICLEPDFFPSKGRYFSVYAYHKGDTVIAFEERPYDYFDKSYYKTPISLGRPSWVEAYSEDVEGRVSKKFSDMIVSYGVPMYNRNKEVVGVISTDLSMPWLSSVVSRYKPYPHAYSVMLGADGQYLIHPDTTKLMRTSIFTDDEVNSNRDIITLGHDMVSGHSGSMTVDIKGERCLVIYQSLKRAPWSVALVCQESEIMAGYNRLLYILIPLLVFGLLVILAFCVNVIAHMIYPLNELTRKLDYITNGHFNEPIDVTSRRDVIGRLQNNFAEMQQNLSGQINSLQEINRATEQMNKELEAAGALALKADIAKSEFLRDVSHQIRTPLNIINGFTQVLRDDYDNIPRAEIEEIIHTMHTNAVNVERMVGMLMVAANCDKNAKINTQEVVNVREFVEEKEFYYATRPPYTVPLTTEVLVLDTYTVKTNREFLSKAVNELLFNAKKFTTEGYVKLTVRAVGLTVLFIVEDTGPGISEVDQTKLFSNFEKGDIFAEGLGLGLPVCRQMIRMIGGDLKFDASYTNGSRFMVVIPNQEAGFDYVNV